MGGHKVVVGMHDTQLHLENVLEQVSNSTNLRKENYTPSLLTPDTVIKSPVSYQLHALAKVCLFRLRNPFCFVTVWSNNTSILRKLIQLISFVNRVFFPDINPNN